MANPNNLLYKVITHDAVDGTDQHLEFTSAVLGYDPLRRAHLIAVRECLAGNSFKIQGANDPAAVDWFDLTVAKTGATEHAFFDDVLMHTHATRPRRLRLWIDATGADPGDIVVEVTSRQVQPIINRY